MGQRVGASRNLRGAPVSFSAMRLTHLDPVGGGQFHLTIDAPDVARAYFREPLPPLLTIAWNRGAPQRVIVDEVPVELPSGAFATLLVSQSFRFERTTDLVLWQFDRAFYCIIDHDPEVSCAGVLFYGAYGVPVLRPDAQESRAFAALTDVFVDEMRTRDAIQGEMLRVLLKRLIIKLTRLARVQLLPPSLQGQQLDLVRRFNMLVEQHYRRRHRVAEYAALLHRSAKTLSNVFARHGQPAPQRIIRARLALEARRRLHYTDRPVKQVAAELGFADVTTFNRFFRGETGRSPARFRLEASRRVVPLPGATGKSASSTGSSALSRRARAS